MPHFDFRDLFSTKDDAAPQTRDLDSVSQNERRHSVVKHNKGANFPKIRLGRTEWVTIIFVAVTFLGGLFCVFRFSNGPDILRSVTAWPREFLYARPLPTTRQAEIEMGAHADRQGEPLLVQSAKLSDANWNSSNLGRSLSPSPSLTSPGPGNTNFPAANPSSNSSPTEASRSSSARAAESHSSKGSSSAPMHSKELDARHTGVVLTTHVSTKKQHDHAGLKQHAHLAEKTATKSPACRQTLQRSRQTSPVAHATKNQVAAVKSTNNLGHQIIGTARAPISSPGTTFRGAGGLSGGGRH